MKIYFACSISGGRKDENIYFELVEFLKTKGDVLNKHVGSLNLKVEEQGLTDEQIYTRCKNWMNECDLVVAEVSTPSLGVGYELSYLESINKKIICLYRKGSEKVLSPVIGGNKYFTVFIYSTISDVKDFLNKSIN